MASPVGLEVPSLIAMAHELWLLRLTAEFAITTCDLPIMKECLIFFALTSENVEEIKIITFPEKMKGQ